VVYAEGYAASFIPAPDPQLSVIARPQKLEDRHAAWSKRLYSWWSPFKTGCTATRLGRSKRCR